MAADGGLGRRTDRAELNPRRPAPKAVWRKHDEPDWPAIHCELQTHNNLTLQLVWEEYRVTSPEGYGYCLPDTAWLSSSPELRK